MEADCVDSPCMVLEGDLSLIPARLGQIPNDYCTIGRPRSQKGFLNRIPGDIVAAEVEIEVLA